MSRNQPRIVEVNFDSKSVTLALPSEGNNSLGNINFKDFDVWVRQRFNLDQKCTLIFTTKDQKEIIPSGDISAYKVINIKVEGRSPVAIMNSKHLISSNSSPSSKQISKSFWSLFVMLVPFSLIALLAVAFGSPASYGIPNITSNAKQTFDSIVQNFGFSTSFRNLLIESYLGFLTWSVSYLFVRRLLNPENGYSIEKFSADAVFGGLAQFVTVFLKGLLK